MWFVDTIVMCGLTQNPQSMQLYKEKTIHKKIHECITLVKFISIGYTEFFH